jgi:hypothetical protein
MDADVLERCSWRSTVDVDHYDAEVLDRLGLLDMPSAVLVAEGVPILRSAHAEGNLALNAGINRLGSLLIAGGGQGLDNAHCRVGVGNGSTAVVNTDTDLSAAAGSSNRWFNMADSANPTFAAQVLTVVSTFSTANGNFAWAEWGIDFGTAASAVVTAPLLNRKVVSLMTKTSSVVAAFTTTITFS